MNYELAKQAEKIARDVAKKQGKEPLWELYLGYAYDKIKDEMLQKSKENIIIADAKLGKERKKTNVRFY